MIDDATTARLKRVALEQAEQSRWKPRIEPQKTRHFEQLVINEFLPPDEQLAATSRILGATLSSAAKRVPYYRELIRDLHISDQALDPSGLLRKLPPLTKTIIREQGDRMTAENLSPKEKILGSYTSSGTTGAPVQIHQTAASGYMRDLLSQRQLRWYRMDPLASMGAIRGARNLPRRNGQLLQPAQTVSVDAWPSSGRFFRTGRFLGFGYDNALHEKADWVTKHKPGYLFSTTSEIEHLAYEFQAREIPSGLLGLRALSEPLTPSQEARITRTFRVPVHISYGLDEVGWVATRCSEGGRYHVHTENCLLEIVDDEGHACRPGEYGRVLLTTLANPAMPLFRYETDDIAQVTEGACPCGRTLPSFRSIIGRRSLMKGLPPGTQDVVTALRTAIDDMPAEDSLSLREYQLRQTLNGSFLLYVVCSGERQRTFDEHIHRVFAENATDYSKASGFTAGLEIVYALSLPRSPSKKFFHFISEFSATALVKDLPELPVTAAGP